MRTKVRGELIRRLREERGLSVRELAQAAEMDRATLYKIENGQQHGSVRSRYLIAQRLNVPLSDIAYAVQVPRQRTQVAA